MMLRRIFAAVAAVTVAMAAPPALAQSNDEAVLFSEGHFKGFSMRISGPTRSIDALLVKSIQIPPGSSWELCSGSTFTGCTRITQSRAAMVMTVRSARPVAPPIPATATVSAGPVKASGGGSLRGLASEFFVTPEDGGNRIEVGPGAGALPRRATEFCRAHGWRTSAYQREQAIEGRRYLADVLCADEGR